MDMPIKDLTALILAGGLGTRLKGVVSDRPKVLASVAGRPFLTYLLDQLERSGIQQVVLCTGHLGDQIEAEFGSEYAGMHLSYSLEANPLGTAGALCLAVDRFGGDRFMVMNGDSFVDADLNAFHAQHVESGFEGSLLLVEVADAGRYGTVNLDQSGQIIGFQEKVGEPVPGVINAGVYLLSRRLLESIEPGKKVSLEAEMLPDWLQSGLGGYLVDGFFIDIGTPESYQLAERLFKDK
jgi:NDP-sugar pyrophosphorylase family protein